MFTIYVVDEQGKKINNSEVPITNDGTYEGYKVLLQILEAHLVELGISQAKQVLLIGDGAEWIWIHIPPLLMRLGCPISTYQLFDFYHVTENLKVFADAAIQDEAQSKQWFIKARKSLKKGNAKSLISQIDELIAVATGERCKMMVGKRNYLLDAYRQGRLNYDKAINKKLPIGSGAF